MTPHFHIAERCPHGTPQPPEEFTQPERLARVPEHLIKQAAINVTAVVDHDTEKCNEVVRRVLAALRLAAPDMPETPVYHYPDGSPTDKPMFAVSGHVCPWGSLRRTGDVKMCQLDEPYPDGEPGPGHDTPGAHAYRLHGDDDYIPFHESDPRTFHASAWLGDTNEDLQAEAELRSYP
jgi:hypothetical protein